MSTCSFEKWGRGVRGPELALIGGPGFSLQGPVVKERVGGMGRRREEARGRLVKGGGGGLEE